MQNQPTPLPQWCINAHVEPDQPVTPLELVDAFTAYLRYLRGSLFTLQALDVAGSLEVWGDRRLNDVAEMLCNMTEEAQALLERFHADENQPRAQGYKDEVTKCLRALCVIADTRMDEDMRTEVVDCLALISQALRIDWDLVGPSQTDEPLEDELTTDGAKAVATHLRHIQKAAEYLARACRTFPGVRHERPPTHKQYPPP